MSPAVAEALAASQPRQRLAALLRRCGIDRPVAYSLLGRAWSLIAGLLTVGLIARFLSPLEQGFYYTFWSVIGLYVFCELGLDFVITQFASHEKAQLEWTGLKTLSGCAVARTRLAALLRCALGWYGAAAGLFLILLLPLGWYFFWRNSSTGQAVGWRLPWICLTGFTVLNLGAAPFFALLEGCGRIAEIALVRTGQNVLGNVGVWLVLALHGGLLAVAAFPAAYFTAGLAWLVWRYGSFFADLLRTDVRRAPFDWRREVWPFQWRIAVSWMSNYFVFQLFNPVLFATHGPVAAGRMGMSLSICNSLLNASMAWMTTKAAPFGALVATRQWRALDDSFFRTFRQSAAILLAGSVAVSILAAIVHARYPRISGRILDPLPFATLLLSMLMSHTVFCEAQYLRAHKQEPFLRLSLAAAALSALAAVTLAKPFGAGGIAAGYLVCSAISLIAGTNIFLQKRRAWHG
jgi:O-antigen/teichoic acid export membrane protein